MARWPGAIAPNGSGKSAPLKAMGRLTAPKSGGAHPGGATISGMSGGERQKAWIGMALAQSPRAMPPDEPAAFLDISHHLKVVDLAADMNGGRGTTATAELHDPNLAARCRPRLIAVKNGAIFADGAADEARRPDIPRAVFGIGARVDKDPLAMRPTRCPFRRAG